TPSATESGAGTPISLTLGIVQGQDFVHALPALTAVEQGFFTKEGLTVTVVNFTSGSDLTKAMAGGSVNVGAATGLDAVSAAAHSVGLKSFYGIEGPSPMTLIVPAKSSITSFADLKGKKVGISAFGSMTDFVVRSTAAKEKVAITDIKEVPLGAPSSVLAALGRGDVDGIILPVYFGYQMEAAGTGKIAESASKVLGSNDQFAQLMASSAYISANSTALKRLAAAYTDSLNYMKSHKDDAVALAVSKLNMSNPIAITSYDALIGNFTPGGKLNAAGLAAYAKALPDLGIATSVPKASDYLSTAIVGK
ncbi:MAG: ABC transporter substrate-binding protein, partial [Actinomycetota bacterium]|nr:ABC transporter substrate-binding protein [Actinomycetota bacterium]